MQIRCRDGRGSDTPKAREASFDVNAGTKAGHLVQHAAGVKRDPGPNGSAEIPAPTAYNKADPVYPGADGRRHGVQAMWRCIPAGPFHTGPLPQCTWLGQRLEKGRQCGTESQRAA